VIVGFPGETEEDFMDTYQFINDLDVSYLHVFTYSERANTPAAEMADIVPIQLRRERNDRLRMLSEKKKHFFYQQYKGETREVLFEHQIENGMISGFTDNYIRVSIPHVPGLENTVKAVKLEKYSGGEAFAGSLDKIREKQFI
jgi:threonylcarbamoyladenosine tRNA methylthiotransferase MtaB